MRRLLAPSLLVLALLLAPGAATAHELSVSVPGSVAIDLGTVTNVRLLHATLVDAGDTIELALDAGTGRDLELLLLVPDDGAEGQARPAEMPTIAGGDLDRTPESIEDEVTGLRYLVLERRALEDGPQELTVARGSAPTRVALRVAPAGEEFVTQDPRRTPRALVRTRAWFEAPAPGARQVERRIPEEDPGARRIRIWVPAAFGVLAILLAGWWLRSGWRSARTRGVERSRRDG